MFSVGVGLQTLPSLPALPTRLDASHNLDADLSKKLTDIYSSVSYCLSFISVVLRMRRSQYMHLLLGEREWVFAENIDFIKKKN